MYRTTGTPSPLSPTPSPAGSVGSVGSQSSGYSSGELAPGQPNGQIGQQQQQRPQQLANSQPLAMSTPNHLNAGPCVSVPLGVHSVMQKQNQYFSYLCTCHELWEQGDSLVQRAQAQGKLSICTTTYFYYLNWLGLNKTPKIHIVFQIFLSNWIGNAGRSHFTVPYATLSATSGLVFNDCVTPTFSRVGSQPTKVKKQKRKKKKQGSSSKQKKVDHAII